MGKQGICHIHNFQTDTYQTDTLARATLFGQGNELYLQLYRHLQLQRQIIKN